jgi:hypothetical protein
MLDRKKHGLGMQENHNKFAFVTPLTFTNTAFSTAAVKSLHNERITPK